MQRDRKFPLFRGKKTGHGIPPLSCSPFITHLLTPQHRSAAKLYRSNQNSYPRQFQLFLFGECGFKFFKSFRVLLTDKIALRIFVSAGNTVQKAGDQLFDEKIVRLRIVCIADALCLCRDKTGICVSNRGAMDSLSSAPS